MRGTSVPSFQNGRNANMTDRGNKAKETHHDLVRGVLLRGRSHRHVLPSERQPSYTHKEVAARPLLYHGVMETIGVKRH